ncbi:hypothetical protein [Coralloluteibacterium thermophilus]|uniref:SGNH/GDSL hydrolase family protein n=1 Tax=Coralloluteibacterium thermophilum TaxID=2707049 RepID=A0ABV9NPN3_9GAMM
MAISQSILTTRRGAFRAIYRDLDRGRRLAATPVVFCEGDSWFSTPLSMNLLDWLVYPAPEDAARGVPVFGGGGLFFRAERIGDTAEAMFGPRNVADLLRWYRGFEFDLVLLSAGGNDATGQFLLDLFAGEADLGLDAALARMRGSGIYPRVRQAYARFIAAFGAARPGTPILAHTYDYPQLIGVPARLTVANVGAAALFKKGAGPWIVPGLRRALPDPAEQLAFAHTLIDDFEREVLRPLREDPALPPVFDYVDLRGGLPSPDDWFDELHPTGAGFHTLAQRLRAAMQARLPVEKGGRAAP